MFISQRIAQMRERERERERELNRVHRTDRTFYEREREREREREQWRIQKFKNRGARSRRGLKIVRMPLHALPMFL